MIFFEESYSSVCVAVLGLRCCVQLSLVLACRLLNVVAILAADHGLQGMWAQKLRCTGLAPYACGILVPEPETECVPCIG